MGLGCDVFNTSRPMADGDLLGLCGGDGADGKLGQRVPARLGARAFETVCQALAARRRNHTCT